MSESYHRGMNGVLYQNQSILVRPSESGLPRKSESDDKALAYLLLNWIDRHCLAVFMFTHQNVHASKVHHPDVVSTTLVISADGFRLIVTA